MAILLIECLFLLFLVIFVGLTIRRKLRKPFFSSTPERVGRLSLKDCELIDCNLPLAEAFGFLNCHDCLQGEVEVDFDQDTVFLGPHICQLRMGNEIVKTIEIRVIAHVESRHLDFMVINIVIGQPEKFDLFTQLSLPLLKLDRKLAIIDLNPLANQVFGHSKKGMPVSTLIAPSFRNRTNAILLGRSRRHKTFSLSVLVVSANGESFAQRWSITAKSPEELMLSCFSIVKNREEKWLYYEQVYPGQSVFWELDLSNSVIRHDPIGLAWQHNFKLTKGTSFVTWLGMVHPQDRPRVSREFESFFLNPDSQLNSTYRMASIQGLELMVTSIGSHPNARFVKGIHQIIESHHFNEDTESHFYERASSEFSILCRSMGLQAKWINQESKTGLPVDLDLRKILSLIMGDNKDVKEVCIETIQPSHQKVHCTSCGKGINTESVTLTIKIPSLNFPPQHINQILKYGYHSQALLVNDNIELDQKPTEVLGIQERVHFLGGHLTVNASDGNMVFVIFLPVKEASEASIEPVKDPIPDLATESNDTVQNLLIIDDQEVVLRYLCETLRLAGYQVTGFSNPIEALADFESDIFNYDLVITDQNMEGLSGTEIISLMLSKRPKLPIVLCSGQVQPLGDQGAIDLGASAFFRKPLDIQKLVSFCQSQLPTAD